MKFVKIPGQIQCKNCGCILEAHDRFRCDESSVAIMDLAKKHHPELVKFDESDFHKYYLSLLVLSGYLGKEQQ